MSECENGDQCREWNCQALHTQDRPKLCFFQQYCYNTSCLRLHPPDRQLCSSGVECTEFACQLTHPPGRMSQCEQGNTCGNYYCMYLHPPEWDPCEIGSDCNDINCPHTSHPADRNLGLQQRFNSRIYSLQCRKQLKNIEQRNIDRRKIKLPILESKDDFCQCLEKERILIVSAETGSGKSTQLPQYAAEYFGGLVVCTQPRVVAAISLARRVANEYDGTSVGESVGYQVGYGGTNRENNRVPGADIMFMTDSALIQESQRDSQLSKIKVLIIDEAHERSLNTDIVIGLAKLLLNSRSEDFYVVIASATIDPIQFLNFFGRTSSAVLNVPGRVFDVSLEYIPKSDDSTDDFEVSTVLKTYKDRPEGHILVFLPGQREIEKALKLFNRDIPDNCVALPLYGSLSPEEQDRVLQFDDGLTGNRRMVVFCTNVAETSLTIKNVRVVIDSGLAKEARFDPKRRLTVIETVRISKSSANQRKGRAGRTAPGHCIRLYNENELTRPNIEPEILRSSLDLTVLQLLRLNLNPCGFPFISQPDRTTLHQSLQLLQNLGCIDEKKFITQRGKLFTELGLDPRLSAFIVDTYIEHSPIVELSATIVAILTAPGSLFFMGGASKEEKQAARSRVALGAQEHHSDLMYLASVYKKWQSAGTIDISTRVCLTCQTTIKRYNSCRSCRVKYAVGEKLNNKVLSTIEVTANNAIKTISNKCWKINSNISTTPDEIDVIGNHLFKKFPEQHGHLLVPHLPNEGVRMVINEIRARITNISAFVQRQIGNNHFIAMSISKLSTGDYVIERLHPIKVSGSSSLWTIEKLYTISNVGWRWNSELRQQINSFKGHSWDKWLVYEYNSRECEVIIWGEIDTKELITQKCSSVVNNTFNSLLEQTRSIECGPIQGSFEGGLVCSRVENLHHISNTKNRINLQNIPCKNFEELDEWLHSKLEIRLKDVRENNFQPCKETIETDDEYEAPPFFITLKSEEVFKNAVIRVPPYYSCSQILHSTNTLHMNEKDAWGRQLLITLNNAQFLSEQEVRTNLGSSIIGFKQLGRKQLPGIQLNNMPAFADETYIKNALGYDLVWTRISILKSDTSDPQCGSTSARVYFDDKSQCMKARHRLYTNGFRRPHSITIFPQKSEEYKDIEVEPSVEMLKPKPQTYLCTAISRQAALDIYSKKFRFQVNSTSSVTVTHLDLYPKFKNLLKHICDRFHTKVEEEPLPAKKGYSDAIRCIFTGASPPVTAMAASVLNQATSPIIIKLNDDRQKYLFEELFKENLMEKWAKELKLSCEKKDKYGTIVEIYGPQIQQGQLMRRIADYSIDFDKRYRIMDITADIVGYFGRNKAADVKLQEINSKWSAEGCSVIFVRRTSSIRLYAQPKVTIETIASVEENVKELLDKLVSTEIDDENTTKKTDFVRQCAFCHRKMAATRTFSICGHAYCRCAVNMLNQLPLQCPTCSRKIHIQDIQEIFINNRTEFKLLCKASIQNYLLSSGNSKNNDQIFCPNDECNGLIVRSQGYQTCLTCGQRVCAICRLIDDELHESRTCTERDEAQRGSGEFLPRLFQEAEKFIKNSWSNDLPPIIRFDCNGYLNQVICESLLRFYNGVKSVGDSVPPDIARGFFAFHGTSVNAIESICRSGFDPSRRSGQVHGPGEYFGITPAISHGYCIKDSLPSDNFMMIIAFILRCNQVSSRPGLCYIVNNPKDWSAAFNLPVAVITYGTDTKNIRSLSFTTHSDTIDSTKTSSKWVSPFRWHWCQDNNQFEPYNDKINTELEQLYEKWMLENGPSIVTTSPLIRYVDDIPQTYSIDFRQNTQTNTKTHYCRRIERRAMNPSQITSEKHWNFRNEHQQLVPYESLIQNTIENAYQAYRSQRGPSTLLIQFPGRPESYRIDFIQGRQMNMTSGEVRLIERT